MKGNREPRQARPIRELALLVAVFACLAATYSVVTPLFEASDELSHYPFVQHLARGGGLPVQDPAHPGPWLQEGSQPPLYYALAALVSRWVPDADYARLLVRNPHADIGAIRPDGNANMVIHGAQESFPYRGAALAIHLVRGLSVLLASLTVLLAGLIGLEVLPSRPGLALAGAAAVAFTPMFLFISGSVNNDNLVVTLATASVWLLLRLLRLPPTPGRWALLGALSGAAALSKVSGLGLLPLAALGLAWVAWRRRAWRAFVWGGACMVGTAALVAGWWYLRNWRLYHDPLGLNMMVAIAEPRAARPTLAQLLGEGRGFVMAYWGLFGGVNVAPPAWFYRLLDGVALLSLGGLLAGAMRRLWRGPRPDPDTVFRLLLVAAWPLIVTLALVRWTMLTKASQGRLLFPAIACLSYLLVLGLASWIPRGRRGSNREGAKNAKEVQFLSFLRVLRVFAVRSPVLLGVGLLAGLAFWVPFRVIAPAYARPPLLSVAEEARIPQRLDLSFDGQMALLGYRLGAAELKPGQDLPVTLYWRSLAPMARNYSVFIHLLDENGFTVGQRDVYPGRGLFPTSLWRPGDAIADTYYVRVPDDTFSPTHLQVEVGLYRYEDGRRLPIRDKDGRQAGSSAVFGQVLVRAEPHGEIANPLHYNLDNKVALVGYNLDRTSLPAGETLQLTLFWQAMAPLGDGYAPFARVLGPDGALWAGRVGSSTPLSHWAPGQVVRESYQLALRPDTPEGACRIEAGIYLRATGQDLVLRDRWGHAQDGPIVLKWIRALPRAAAAAQAEFSFPAIQYPLEVTFGSVARLRGFSLAETAANPGEPLAVTLYWQALAGPPAAVSYAVFVHALDAGNRIVAQHDSPPALGAWPTTAWASGQAIVDRHDLSFKDARYRGQVRLEIGLYDPQSGQRLKTDSGDDKAILPMQISVQP